MIVVVYWGLPRDPLALECVSVIGSALTLLALWGYAAVFWRAGGAGTHRFLRDNYRNGPGFKTVIWILVATVACVIASAFIATQLGLFMILMFIVCVLGSLQLRAERHWYAWTKILTGNAPAR